MTITHLAKLALLLAIACGINGMQEDVLILSKSDAAPLLDVISRLQRVKVVPPSPYLERGLPLLCWLDDAKFRRLSAALLAYKNENRDRTLDWYLISDVPRACLVGVPTANLPQATAEQLKKRAVSELPQLASSIERTLALRGDPSLGIEEIIGSLELPFMEDRFGRTGVAVVADPVQFGRTHLPTSQYDRQLHFGVDRAERQELASFLNTEDHVKENWAMLARVADSAFGGMFDPKEVSLLAAELDRIGASGKSKSLASLSEKLKAICRSAAHYRLGIYIPSEE